MPKWATIAIAKTTTPRERGDEWRVFPALFIAIVVSLYRYYALIAKKPLTNTNLILTNNKIAL